MLLKPGRGRRSIIPDESPALAAPEPEPGRSPPSVGLIGRSPACRLDRARTRRGCGFVPEASLNSEGVFSFERQQSC